MIRHHDSDIDVQDVPIITADVSDKSSLESLAKSTKVVLATAGPFAVFGTPMVEACLATSTNYCDITGTACPISIPPVVHLVAARIKPFVFVCSLAQR